MSDRWEVEFSSPREAALALKRLRGFGGSRARDHWAVELAKFSILLVLFALALADRIHARDLIFFILGYLGLSIFNRRLKPILLVRFGPKEFRFSGPARVKLDSDGLKSEGDGSLLELGWHKVPEPTAYRNGLVFRVAHEAAIPFPTSRLDITAQELAEQVKHWKSAQRA